MLRDPIITFSKQSDILEMIQRQWMESWRLTIQRSHYIKEIKGTFNPVLLGYSNFSLAVTSLGISLSS